MNVVSPLLDRLQQLTHSHTHQFGPSLDQIRQRLDRELAQLQQQEAELVHAQSQILQELKQAINDDARFLLKTEQFQSFVDSVLPKAHPYFQPTLTVEDKVADWLLNQSAPVIGISNYQEEIDHDGYDDERTYTSYSYSADIQWGQESVRIQEIQTQRIYGVLEHRVYGSQDQIAAICDSFYDYREWREKSEVEKRLVLEMGYLIYYGCTLLTLQPQRVEIKYDSTTGAE